MADMDRRNFLGGAGLLAGLAAACGPRRDPYAAEKPPVPVGHGSRAGSEDFVVSTCGLCHASCGIRVRVVSGRAVKIEGNPNSPVNRGGVCARGQAGLEILYHPDRVRGPMRRVGARGENRWRTISWNEALEQLASELHKLREAGKPESLVLIDGEDTGATHALWARFMTSFGSPNHIGHGATSFGAVVQVMAAMTGRAALPGYDFERSRCVLLVGAGPLESSPLWIHLARALAGESRPRLLLASSRLPSSAALVDEWLAVMPGSEARLVLGLVHVLLREQLGDESALERVAGFGPWVDGSGAQPGLRARVMAEFSPGSVAHATGIPVERIESLARNLVATRPSLVVADEWSSDGASVAAVFVLNALLGNLDAEGGILVGPGLDLAGLGTTRGDDTARAGLSAPRIDGRDASEGGFYSSRVLALPEAFLTGQPYPAKALFLYYSNPVFSKPGPRWTGAIAKVPLVVSFSPVLDESVLFADLVLPDHTFLERWDVVSPGRGTRALSLRQPVVQPLGDSMQSADVILGLAAKMGGSIADAFPWGSYREVVAARLAGLKGGADAVLAELASKGVYVESNPARQRTALLDVTGTLGRSPLSFAGDLARFPFVLVPFRGAGYAEGGTRQLAWLSELPLVGGAAPWRERVEISPEDARALGARDGDRVNIESPTATVELRAHVRPGIRPGVLGLPLGGGAPPAGRGTAGASRLLSDSVDASSGLWFACATRARAWKVT